ncbi:MAG: threonylcarbamoyl-AMP synthase [Gammaproteobacteria bacterium]|nr:threonylcarbamoyl-AMP synthase [Gammaproteobacteria bacterium]
MTESRAIEAAKRLRKGELIAYPTEAVWGIGCDPFNREAVYRLLRLKRRPVDNGLLLVAAGIEQVGELLTHLTDDQIAKLRSTWPGHITWLVPDPDRQYPEWIRGEHSAVAIRVSDHPVVRELCVAFGGPIVSPSANLAGEPELRSMEDVLRQFGADIDCIVEGKLGGQGKPSEIRDLVTGERIR